MSGFMTAAELALFVDAFATTLAVSMAGIVLATLLALPLALALRARSRLLRLPARCYTDFMRGAPLVILLFLFYYGGPSFAAHAANRVVFMDGGRIVEEGPPRTLFAAPASPRLGQFLQTWRERAL